jgi:Zn-finger nucleic acid-binding protein
MPDCPLCRTSMRLNVSDSREIDMCDNCSAIWLAANELHTIDCDLTGQRSIELKSSFKCPDCNGRGCNAIQTESTNVVMCHTCRGTLLQGGKVERFFRTKETSPAETENADSQSMFMFLGELLSNISG